MFSKNVPELHSNIWAICDQSYNRVYIMPSVNLCMTRFHFRKRNCRHVGWDITVTVCVGFTEKTKNSLVSHQILSTSRRLLWMVIVTLNIPSYHFLFRKDLLFYKPLSFCFFIFVNVLNVYILCFDHSILIFQFLCTLYVSAPYLRPFLYC